MAEAAQVAGGVVLIEVEGGAVRSGGTSGAVLPAKRIHSPTVPLCTLCGEAILRKANLILRFLFSTLPFLFSFSFSLAPRVMGSARSSCERERAIAWPQDLQRS